MDTQDATEKTVSLKKARKKKGLIYLVIAAVCLAISLILHASGISGGIIFALLSLAWVVSLVMGAVYLIMGFAGKGQ